MSKAKKPLKKFFVPEFNQVVEAETAVEAAEIARASAPAKQVPVETKTVEEKKPKKSTK